MGSSQSLSNQLDRVLLVLVGHLGFVFILNYLGRRKQWAQFTMWIWTLFNSMAMHLCQLSTDYDITGDGFCYIGNGYDVNTGTALADYVTAYNTLPLFSLWGPDVTRLHFAIANTSNVMVLYNIISATAPSKTQPIVAAAVLLVLHWTIRLVRMSNQPGKLKEFGETRFEPWSLVAAIVFLVAGGLCYLFQTDDNYVYLHMAWMNLGAIGAYFLYRVLDPSPIIYDFIYCCASSTRPVKEPTESKIHDDHLDDFRKIQTHLEPQGLKLEVVDIHKSTEGGLRQQQNVSVHTTETRSTVDHNTIPLVNVQPNGHHRHSNENEDDEEEDRHEHIYPELYPLMKL